MKKLIVSVILTLSGICFATDANTVGIKTSGDNIQIYWKCTGDFNDANVAVYDNFYGMLESIKIDPAGTDTDYDIKIYIDPYEYDRNGVLASTQTEKRYLVWPTSDITLTTATDYYDYDIPSADQSSNIAMGWKDGGKLYIARVNCASTLTSITVWLNARK